MITTKVSLYALPSYLWEKSTRWGNAHIDIGPFVEDALNIEKRIGKGVNQENERARYTLCCNRLEAMIKTLSSQSVYDLESFRSALQNFQIPFVSLSYDYLDKIHQMYQRSPVECSIMRLGTSFFPIETIEPHINLFSTCVKELGIYHQEDIKQRISFYETALDLQCGVIEIQDPFSFSDDDGVDLSGKILLQEDKEIKAYQMSLVEEYDLYKEEPVEFSIPMRRKAYDILYEQVSNAVAQAKVGENGAVNFSNQPHNIITEVLNAFVYSESGQVENPVYIRVNYTDGSQGKPFPLRCLPKRSNDALKIIQQTTPLKAALLSMRHLSMDRDVDMAWFRNREVSKARAFGETDHFCYEYSKKLFEQSREEGILRLFLYQTGLQPAVIGFYRALTEELLYRANNPPSLEVTPHFYVKQSDYRQGCSWN
ncbi:MAG: hypothetical protein GYA36_20020 [Veillonellaceae bacterium]|nr:hypothetical protein [Veillonellaceae bacterium]